jgi:serine/threonine-protein kinase
VLQRALSDRYRLERELGRGGMATVYLAHDLRHDRDVAIKVLHQDLGAALGAERFLAEIRTTARLQHPHILPLLDSGEADGLLYYVMTYVAGESLRDRLTRERQLPIDVAVRITREVADALGEAHALGIVHRDVKPENILLRGGHALVADFGIALAVSAAADDGRMTESGFTLGTPRYMSPEQATAEKEITSRADIYSLGCVAYEMLTGSPPHIGATAQQILMKIVTEEVTPVTRLRKAVPPNVSAAVAQSLEKIPADRFETAKAFADALTNPTYATLRSVAGEVVLRERRWSRDPRSIGVASVAAVSSVALIWALTRPASATGPAAYDVGLPDSATMTTEQGVGFAVAPNGGFVVYQASGGAGGLWYRSLRDQIVYRIDGTEHGSRPAISPDEKKVAFLRSGSGNDWTLETVSIEGGTPVEIGRGTGSTELSLFWRTDESARAADTLGLRRLDAPGGLVISDSLPGCSMPFLTPYGRRRLCGFGGSRLAIIAAGFTDAARTPLRTSAGDTVFGTRFRLVDERYLVYLSIRGDLVAAPFDVKTLRVGRSVPLAKGIARRGDTGMGAYDLTPAGTLVYAQGANHAVGSLVAINERDVNVLPVGQAAFRMFSPSPDGTQLAAIVSVDNGEELRVYNLRTGGDPVVWRKDADLTLPVWNARGDRLIFGRSGTLFVGSPDQSTRPESVYYQPGVPEAFSWDADDRVIFEEWISHRFFSLDLKTTPPAVALLADSAANPSLSPDGRWISYTSRDGKALWLRPMPQNGKRYHVAGGHITSSGWLSGTELTMAFKDSTGAMAIDRITIDVSGPTPAFPRRHWLTLSDFVPVVGPSYTRMPDGRVLYLRGAPERPVQYLRVVPNWVSKMEHDVDNANPQWRHAGWIDRLRK